MFGPTPTMKLLFSGTVMVEAPGIEPGSGSTTSKRLHAFLAYLDLGIGNAGKKAFPAPIPLNLA